VGMISRSNHAEIHYPFVGQHLPHILIYVTSLEIIGFGEDFIPGSFIPGGFILGAFIDGVFTPGAFTPRAFIPRVFHFRGIRPREFRSKGIVPRESQAVKMHPVGDLYV